LFAGKFKGQCNFCGKYGHKGAKCKAKFSNQQQDSKKDYGKFVKDHEKKFDDSCKYCNKKGHNISDCRKLIANEQRKQEQDIRKLKIAQVRISSWSLHMKLLPTLEPKKITSLGLETQEPTHIWSTV
jgi:hypothetical protein